MIILSTADFTGWYWIPVTTGTDQSEEILQDFIDRYERNAIRELLGVELGDLFITDLANASQEARFAAIEDAFAYDDPNGSSTQYISQGIAEYLKAYVYYRYVSDRQARNTHGGVAFNTNEAQNVADMHNAYRYAEKRWNEALETVAAIQWYCADYQKADYPEYNGQVMKRRFSPIF